jgi:hypothetical protein
LVVRIPNFHFPISDFIATSLREGGPVAMRAFLSIEYGEARGEIRRLERRSVTAGRDLSCAVWLPDDSIRPRHAEFFVRDGRWFVRVMEPTAPLRVNNLPTSESALDDGDRILLGDVEMQFRVRGGLPRAAWVVIAVGVGVAGAAGIGWWRARTRTDAPTPDAGTAPGRPAPTRPDTPPADADVTEISRRLEEAMTNRVERLETERPLPTTALPAAPPLSAEPEVPRGQAEAHGDLALALAEVRALTERGEISAARARVDALRQAHPNSLPVLAEWARLEERAGHIDGAESTWKNILAQAVQGEWYNRAAQELSRLALLQIHTAPPPVPAIAPNIPDFNRGLPADFRPGVTPPSILGPMPFAPILPPPTTPTPPPPPTAPLTPRIPESPTPARPAPGGAPEPPPLVVRPPAPVPEPTPPARPRPVVRIGSVNLRRMPPGPDAEDTRLLEVQLERADGAEWIRPDKVVIEAVFFDAPAGGAPRPTQAFTGASRVTLDARAWTSIPATATFSYSIPRGSNAGPFHGYRVRVYYDGQPQDAQAKPEALGP